MLAKAILFRSVAIASAIATVILVSRYPLGWLAPTAILGAYAALLWHRPHWWIYALLTLLPVLNLYPWTGWLFVEEFDLAVLATLAVGYLRARTERPGHRFTPLGAIAVGALTLSYGASALLPLRDMPQVGWEALATYYTPLNALRVLKGWAWPLLLLPLLRRAADEHGDHFSDVVAKAMLGGLAITSLVVLWERNAFPGLMNFSADYRAIGPFFEAHVGGAALDGYFALGLPFALWLLLEARSVQAIGISAGLLLLGTYASFATFSRGLYLGIALALVVLAGITVFRRKDGNAHHLSDVAVVVLGIGLLVGMLLLAQVFATGGYRTLAAALGFCAGAFYVGGLKGAVSWKGTLGLLAILSSLTWAFTYLVPKGAYVIYAVSVAALMACGYLERLGRAIRLEIIVAVWLWIGSGCLAVGQHWGGVNALQDASLTVVVIAMMALYNRGSALPLWSLSWRTTAVAIGAGLLLGISIPVVGNYYMKERIQTVAHDLQTRENHWRSSMEIRGGGIEQSLFGAGLGTYPERYFWRNAKGDHPGVVFFMTENGQAFVRLGKPRSGTGRSVEPLRFAQRVPIEADRTLIVQVTLRSKAPKTVLRVNLCEKWLLYVERCTRKPVGFQPDPGEWQTFSAEISTGSLGQLHWWGKRSTLLGMAVDGKGNVMDVSDIRLIDPSKGDLIANGDMKAGGDRWYFTSDRSHLPWHAKNLWLGIWFDQGWLGLTGFMAVLVAGLAGCWRAASETGSLAAVARLAGIAAFLVVGLFDTLLDATRLAAAFYLLLFSGMLISRRVVPARAGSSGRSRRSRRHHHQVTKTTSAQPR